MKRIVLVFALMFLISISSVVQVFHVQAGGDPCSPPSSRLAYVSKAGGLEKLVILGLHGEHTIIPNPGTTVTYPNWMDNGRLRYMVYYQHNVQIFDYEEEKRLSALVADLSQATVLPSLWPGYSAVVIVNPEFSDTVLLGINETGAFPLHVFPDRASFSFSRVGSIVSIQPVSEALSELVLLDAKLKSTILEKGSFRQAVISPDGEIVAYSKDGEQGIYFQSLEGAKSQVSLEPGVISLLGWHPIAHQLLVSVGNGSYSSLYLLDQHTGANIALVSRSSDFYEAEMSIYGQIAVVRPSEDHDGLSIIEILEPENDKWVKVCTIGYGRDVKWEPKVNPNFIPNADLWYSFSLPDESEV